MKSHQATTLFLLCFIAFCSFSGKTKKSKDQMYLKNAEHTNKHKSKPVKTTPSELWKIKTDGQVISSPIIHNNTLYIGSTDHNLYAINPEDGSIKWTFKTNGQITSTPAISQDKIMFLSYDGNFYAVNLDGSLAWKFKTEGESKHRVKDYFDNSIFGEDFWDFYLSSAVVKKGVVYFGSSDKHIYALDIESGKQKWRFKTKGQVHSTPAISKNSIFVGDFDSNLYSINTATGEQNWIFTTPRDTTKYVWIGFQSSPLIKNGVVYIGSRDASVYALDSKTGEKIWRQTDFARSWVPGSAATDGEYLYTGSSAAFKFYAINMVTGDIKYKTPTKSYTFSSPAIDSKMAYIGSANGRLYGIELSSGDVKWEYQTEGSKTDPDHWFDENGDANKEANKNMPKFTKMSEVTEFFTQCFQNYGAVLSSPLISDQVVYFGSCDGYIYAISDKKK